MLYRLDELIENRINPITNFEYDNSWIILMLTDSVDYKIMCGSNNNCAYTIKVSRLQNNNWKTIVGDFIDFNKSNDKNIILVISEEDLNSVKNSYYGHSYNEKVLRKYEPGFLVHSTTMDNWNSIERDGMLKSWNTLKKENPGFEEQPIGLKLGDHIDFSDYIMFGGGITGEIVVNSKQKGIISMNENEEYLTGARLYFDAKKIAEDGLLIRDGCHIKVKNTLPLKPYLVFVATYKSIGLGTQISTPKKFSEIADKQFKIFIKNNFS